MEQFYFGTTITVLIKDIVKQTSNAINYSKISALLSRKISDSPFLQVLFWSDRFVNADDPEVKDNVELDDE
jgi:hypothetical protein